MGLDLLDIVFRLEKSCSIKILRADVERMLAGRHWTDLAAGDLYD